MNDSINCDRQANYEDLAKRFSKILSEVQWLIIERRFIYGESLDQIGGEYLGMARSRVRQIEIMAIETIGEQFHHEIECFSEVLEKSLAEAGGALRVKECLRLFANISEAEFRIVLAACLKKQGDDNDLSKLFVIDKDTGCVRLMCR